MKSNLPKKIILSVFVFFVFPFFVNAQSVEIRSSSLYPDVGDNVSVSVFSFDVDTTSSEISWYKDGKFETKGVGLKNFSFNVGSDGNVIRASIKTNNSVIERSIIIKPSSMDVLWEVVGGYEPPFYKGKIFPTKGSRIKVVAIPQITNEKGFVPDQGVFVYAWRRDGSNFAGQSGYGKNSFNYSPGVLDRQNTIEVTASGLSRSLAKSITITPANSEIHFYENSSVYGPLYNKVIKDNISLDRNIIAIIAEPYFISSKDLESPSLEAGWKVNNLAVNSISPNTILLNAEEGVTNARIDFEIKNKIELLQDVSRSLRLNFSNNE